MRRVVGEMAHMAGNADLQASCCVNAAPPDDGDGLERRPVLPVGASDRHRPPPAGEHILAHAGVARRRPASPSGPGAVRRCGPPGRVPTWRSAFPVGSTNSEYVPKLSCYFGMTSKIDTYPRTWRTLSPVRLARPRIPSLATPATQGIADGDEGGTERIGPTHSRR